MSLSVADDARFLDDRYDLLERIGSGGMGTVYRAHDRRLDREVAIKVLHEGADGDDVRRARLQSEARFAGALQHPGIVQVFDYGEEHQPDGRIRPYVVMQHVEGSPLSAALRNDGPMPPARVGHLLAGIAAALAAAHGRGIVHRDLKPSNILLTEADDPVLVDFGIARSDDAEPLTQTGEIIGTADYLSPEQVRGERATRASDVYALGVVAYQCLTATSPFHRDTHVATALAHLNDTAPPLPASVPPGLRDLVHQMLATDAADRPDAAAIAERAAMVDRSPTVVLPPLPTTPPPSAAAAAATAGAVARTARSTMRETSSRAWSGVRTRWSALPPRPRIAAVALAAAVVLVLAVLLGGLTGRDPGTEPAAADLAVPPVRGEQLAAARHELRAAGFDVRVRRVDGDRPAGRVLAQDPAPGAYSGSTPATVTLQVSSGFTSVPAASLVGQQYDAAAATLADHGVTATRVDQTTSTAAPGTVVATSAQGRMPVGSTVLLTVAAAPQPQYQAPPAKHSKPAKHDKHGHGKKGKH